MAYCLVFSPQYSLRIMESCPKSGGVAVAAPEAVALPTGQEHVEDPTDDLEQRLEDIINTYQTEEGAVDPEDPEELTGTKHTDSRRDQKLEKKMLKNLGGYSTSMAQHAKMIYFGYR